MSMHTNDGLTEANVANGMNRAASVVVAAATLLAATALMGCNTVKGAGEDIQNAAESTEKAIENATDGK